MTPQEYESSVAEHYRSLGYAVTTTPMSNDYGVDMVAVKGHDRIAVQAKMYGGSTRKVNHAMVMELFGAMTVAECNRAIIVTDGLVLDDAAEIAKRLGIEILFLQANTEERRPACESELPTTPNAALETQLSFDGIWREYIIPLVGKPITTKTGRSNKILAVDWTQVKRVTSKGNVGTIPIEPFRFAIERLLESGNVSRDEINQRFSKERCSSGVIAVLSQVPFFVLSEGGSAMLHYRHQAVKG